MSNVNDNNLDDLLRRAAEKYPLRTDSADFSKLVSDLEKDPSLILPPLNAEDRRRRRFLWLFLLLPLAGGAYFAWHAGTRSKGPVQAVTQVKEAGNGGPAIAGGEDGVANGGDGVANGGDGVTGGRKVITKGDHPTVKGGSDGPAVAGSGSGKDKIKNGDEKEVAANTGNEKKVSGDIGKSGVGPAGNEIVGRSENGSGRTVNKAVVGKQTDLGNATVTGRRKKNGDDAGTTSRDRSGVGGRVPLVSTKGEVGVNMPVTAKTDHPVEIKKEAPAKKDPTRLQKPKHSFYVGIIGSPDLSLVKFQSVKNVGDNIGVLFGYTLNSHWSIETGLSYDRKKYYTNGEYFSKSKLPAVMNDIDLKRVEGGCNMWEIPLNVRYNFHSPNGKMQWFATGGLSTYLMAKEVYTFYGNYWGNPNWKKTYPYETPYKYWFSILNLSVGFEQPLGKIGNLRLEPFVRVPLSGIGTGSLSIMSAGLNIGITRRIW